MFTVHDLAALVAVAESGSVRRAAPPGADAARRQPSHSEARGGVGFALLDRSGYRVRLTERARRSSNGARHRQPARDLHAFASVLSRGRRSAPGIEVHGALPQQLGCILMTTWNALPATVLKFELARGRADPPLDARRSDMAVVLSRQQTRLRRVMCKGWVSSVRECRTLEPAVSHLDDDLALLPQISSRISMIP